MPWAVFGAIGLPQLAALAAASRTASMRGSRTNERLNWYGSCPIAFATWSTISSLATVTSGL